MSVNKAIIVGHLGRDPEMKSFSNGGQVANFSVATTEKWRDKNTGESKEATEWHRIQASGKLAEIVGQYVKKGSLVYVEGSLRTRKWTDQSGAEKSVTEIRADMLRMLSGRSGAGNENGGSAPRTGAAPKAANSRQPVADAGEDFHGDAFDEDIPF